MRFKMRTSSSRIVVLLLVMMTSLICHPSLASGSRDLIDDHAPDKFARSGRYYPVRNRNIVEELQPYVLEQVRNRIFPPFPYQHNANHRLRGRGSSERYYPVRNRNFEKEFQSNDLEQVRNRIFPRPPQAGPSGVRPPQAGPSGVRPPQAGPSGVRPPQAGPSGARPPQAGPSGARPPQAGTTQPVYRGDLPQPSEDFPLEDPPPHYSEHEKAAPPPPYASLGQPAQPLSAADIHQLPPAYDQIYPKVPRPAAAGLAQGILYLGQRVLDQIAEGNPRPNIDPFDAQSEDAQRIFGLITPKIQRERQTLQDMEMKYATKIEGTRSYEFVFKATDIDPRPTRIAGWREPVKCRVRANPTPMLRDFTISGLTCERKKMDLRGLSLTSIQYYPAARGRPNPGPVNAQSAAGQVGRILGLGEHVPDQSSEPNPRPNIDPFDAQSQDAQRIFELIKPKIQRERQTLHDMQMKDATKIEGTPSFEFVFKAKDIVPRTNGWREPVPVKCRVRANPTPMLRDFTISGLTCERKKMNLRGLSLTSIQYYPAGRGRPNPGPVNAQSAAGQVGRILGLGEHVPDQRPEPNPRPNIDPFDAQSQDAQRIFELIKPKIQRERQTLHDMQMKDATKIEGTPSFEFVFKAKDIVPRTNGWREPVPVKCRVRANPTPMLRDFTISGLTCERKKMDLRRLSVTSIQYYPASRGKRASSNKIHNRVSPSIQRSRSGSLQSVSSNDDHPPPSYESVVRPNPPSYQSLFPGSSQPENPSRSSSLSAGSRVEDSNPMGQTYIHKNSPEAKRVFAAIKPQLLRQHPEFRKIRLAPRVLKQELATSSSSPFSVNYKFTLTTTVLVKKRPFYRMDKVHRIPCLVQVYKTGANGYEMLCTCSSY